MAHFYHIFEGVIFAMKSLWIELTAEEFHALFDYLTKLEKLELSEEVRTILEEVRKILF